jgi:hypothetical protein
MKVTDEIVSAALQTYKSLETRDMVRDLLRASAKEDSWIVEAEDSLPAYREQVLIKVSYKPEVLLGAYHNIDGWRGDCGHIYNITHWQPLPFSFDEYLMKLAIKAAIQAAWVKFDIDNPVTYPQVGAHAFRYLVRTTNVVKTIPIIAHWNGRNWFANQMNIDVTHWMPLPEFKEVEV